MIVDLAPKVALVTGATGFTGRNTVIHLRATGWVVHELSRTTASMKHSYNGTVVSLMDIMDAVRPTAIVHLASVALSEHRAEDIDRLIDANIRFPTQLFEAMTAVDCRRVVVAGSFWQHQSGSDTYEPVNLYAATKQACADLLRHYTYNERFQAIELVLFDSYGPGDKRRKLVDLLVNAVWNETALGMTAGDQEINLVHVRDVASAIGVALDRTTFIPPGTQERFAVRSAASMTLRDLVRNVESIVGSSIEIAWGARSYRPREVMRTWHGPILPNWNQSVSLREGITELLQARLTEDDT